MKEIHVRAALVALGLVACGPVLSALVSCGTQQAPHSKMQSISDLGAVDFSTWCRDFALKNCDVQADDKIPVDQWRAGVDVFAELMESLTDIQLTRTDFDRKTVQELFSTFGANSLLSFISKIPWSNLSKEDNALVLRNAAADAVANFNGLRLIGSEKVVAKFVDKQLVAISGLQIADALGGHLSQVRYLDLSQPSRLTIVTASERITGIPVQFFQVPGFQQPPTLTPSAAFNAIANVVLEPGFDWRNNLHILLKGQNLRNIYARIKEYIPEGPADETTRKVIESTDMMMVGGASSNILLSMQMNKPIACKLKINNIPLIGHVDFDVNFSKGFGLSNLVRTKSDGVKTSVYGITTSVGNIESIEVDAAQLRVRLGAFTIPIDFTPPAPGAKGPSLDSVVCN